MTTKRFLRTNGMRQVETNVLFAHQRDIDWGLNHNKYLHWFRAVLSAPLSQKDNLLSLIMTWSVARGALFLACVFAMHCLSVRDVLCAEGLKRTAVGEGFSYGNFVRDQFHYLNATKVGSSLVQDVEVCNVACVANPSCVSFNVAAEPDIHGHLLCELLATDKYNSSDQFVAHPEFHHHSIYVSRFRL